MTIAEKQIVMDTIRDTVPVFKKRTSIQWSIRCPYCGDSKKDPRDSHCYIKWAMDDSPLLFNCFLCNTHGVVDKKFLDLIGVKKDLSELVAFNKSNRFSSIKNKTVDIITGEVDMNSPQVKYIEHRLGPGLIRDDYNKFRILTNISNVLPYVSSDKVKNSLPSNNDSISFLTNDKTVLLTRLFEDGEIRWKKLRIVPNDSKSFYAIQSSFDLFTQDPITINIAEGVMDVISIYKNFNDHGASLFIAALGSDYIDALEYSINLGVIGKNVTVKVYMDADQNEKRLIDELKKYRWLYNGIFVYRNVIGKDVGVRIEDIKLEERRV